MHYNTFAFVSTNRKINIECRLMIACTLFVEAFAARIKVLFFRGNRDNSFLLALCQSVEWTTGTEKIRNQFEQRTNNSCVE